MNLSFKYKPVAPFRLDLTAWALRRTPDNQIDGWDGKAYRRVLALEGRPVEAIVTQEGPPKAPELLVFVNGEIPKRQVEPLVVTALQRSLGVQIDLNGFYRMADSQPMLRPLVERFRGFKPPRFQTVFEALVNAIACQQITLRLGIRMLNRLAGNYGLPYGGPSGKAFAFPRPQDMAGLSVESLRDLGFSHQKGTAIIELARDIVEQRLDFNELETLGNEQAIAYLQQLRGVGRWSAEYVLLRGLGRLDVFPGDDVGARHHLMSWLGLPSIDGYQAVMKTLEPWKPYRGMIYFHLLLKRLDEEGAFHTGEAEEIHFEPDL